MNCNGIASKVYGHREKAPWRVADNCPPNIERRNMDKIKERICSVHNLDKAFMKRKTCRMWKPSVMDYYLHMNRYNHVLHTQLMADTYEVKPCLCFIICDPHLRAIQAPHLIDGIIQSSTNSNYLNAQLRPVFLRENCACQKNKGTDYARELFKEQLRRYYRKYGTDGVVWKIDLKSFFASIDGDALHILNEKYIGNEWVISFVEKWGVPQGSKGLGLGAETNQTESCLALHPIDTFLRTVMGCKYTARYQDDIMVILRGKDEARRIQTALIEELKKYKLTLNKKKTQIYKLTDWYAFLGFRFTITDSGKVLMKVKKENVKRERRRLRHQRDIMLPASEIAISLQCWTANASKGNNYFIVRRTEDFAMEIIREQREMEKKLETSQSTIEKLNATLEYVAMMADVDISQPEETKEGGAV